VLRAGCIPLKLAERRVCLDRLRGEQVVLAEADDRHDLGARLRSQPYETLMERKRMHLGENKLITRREFSVQAWNPVIPHFDTALLPA